MSVTMIDLYVVHKDTRYNRVQAKSMEHEDTCDLCSIKLDSDLCGALCCSDYNEMFTENEVQWYWEKG